MTRRVLTWMAAFLCGSWAVCAQAIILIPTVTLNSVPGAGSAADITYTLTSSSSATNGNLQASCTACAQVTAPANLVGTYGFQITGAGGPPSPTGSGAVQIGTTGIYTETFLDAGSLTVTGTSQPVSAPISGFSLFATPGASSAVLQLDLAGATVGGTLYPLPLYLLVSGSTVNPVSITGSNFDNLALDWTGTLSLNPYTPPTVPLPASVWLMLSGLGGLVMLRRQSRRSLAA